MRRRSQGGRYTVGDKLFVSLLAALAYAQHKTTQDGTTRYVREIGGSLYIIVERDGTTQRTSWTLVRPLDEETSSRR